MPLGAAVKLLLAGLGMVATTAVSVKAWRSKLHYRGQKALQALRGDLRRANLMYIDKKTKYMYLTDCPSGAIGDMLGQTLLLFFCPFIWLVKFPATHYHILFASDDAMSFALDHWNPTSKCLDCDESKASTEICISHLTESSQVAGFRVKEKAVSSEVAANGRPYKIYHVVQVIKESGDTFVHERRVLQLRRALRTSSVGTASSRSTGVCVANFINDPSLKELKLS